MRIQSTPGYAPALTLANPHLSAVPAGAEGHAVHLAESRVDTFSPQTAQPSIHQRVRWSPNAFPLPVMIEGDTQQARFLFAVAKEWEAASGGLVRLTLVEASAENRWSELIHVVWADETTLGRDHEVGHTDRRVRNNGLDKPGNITHATITLITEPDIDGELTPTQQMNRLRATILHEMGHALGLEHSPNPREVMHHRGWKNAVLQPGDLAALKQLYQD